MYSCVPLNVTTSEPVTLEPFWLSVTVLVKTVPSLRWSEPVQVPVRPVEPFVDEPQPMAKPVRTRQARNRDRNMAILSAWAGNRRFQNT